jgi:hypothetical protein
LQTNQGVTTSAIRYLFQNVTPQTTQGQSGQTLG